MSALKKVVIIGGGFAGLYAINKLSEYAYKFEITLIDKSENSVLKPKLTSIAAGKEVENIKVEIAPILREHQSAWVNDEVVKIDEKEQIVYTKEGSYRYDYLIIASGVEYDYKSFKDSDYYSFASYDEALKLESAIANFTQGAINIISLENSLYEGAAIEAAFLIEQRLKDLGVKEQCTINLITQNSEIFPEIGEKSRDLVKKELQSKEINLIEGADLNSMQKGDLTIVLPSFKIPSFASNFANEANGVKSNEFMQVQGFQNLFAVGDINALSTPKLGHNAFKQADVAVNTILKQEEIEKEVQAYEPDILAVIEVDKLEAILIYSNVKFGKDKDFALKSILAKELKIVFKNALYFSLGEIPAKLDETVKKLIEKYADSK